MCVALAAELHAMGHEVTVLAPWFPGVEEHDARQPYRVHRFTGYGFGWARLLPFLRAAWDLAREADAIAAINVSYGGVLARLMHARCGIPYVCFAYAYEFLKFGNAAPARWLLRDIYAHAATTIAISGYTRDKLAEFGVDAQQITLCYPGVTAPPPLPEPALHDVRRRLGLGDAPFVLSAGRFIPRKNHVLLIEAWPRVLEHYPDMHLVMAGRGPEHAWCVKRAAYLGIAGRVHCPGYVADEDLEALMQDCLFFALPNGEDGAGQVEGFGLVFTEAAARGKAVIAGDSGGAREAVSNGETGILVPPGDVDTLAKALLTLIQDDVLRARMGAAGRARTARDFTWRGFAHSVVDAL